MAGRIGNKGIGHLKSGHTSLMQTLRGSQLFRALSLLGLIVQIAVASTHYHNDVRGDRTGAAPSTVLADTGASVSEPQEAPADHGDDNNHCQICWSVTVAGSGILASQADAVAPLFVFSERTAIPNTSPGGGVFAFAFEARGPPAPRQT